MNHLRQPDQAAKDKADRDRHLHAVTAECALRDHKALGRWVRQSRIGRLSIDAAKVAADERLDGKYLLATSDRTCPPRMSRWATRTSYKPHAPSGT